MDVDVAELHEKCKECYCAEKFEEALGFFKKFNNEGKRLFEDAVGGRFDTSIVADNLHLQNVESRVEKRFRIDEGLESTIINIERNVKIAEDWFKKGESWFKDGESWFKEKNARLDNDIVADERNDMRNELFAEIGEGFYYWGYSLAYLGRVKKYKKEYDEAMNFFKSALEKFEVSIGLGWAHPDLSYENMMATNYRMYQIGGDHYQENAKMYFGKTKKDILEILVWLDEDVRDDILKNNFFYDVLGDPRTADGRFFGETVDCGDCSSSVDVYKRLYICSIYIISLLYVDNAIETVVGHYRGKESSQNMLFKDEKLRMGAVDYSNDPTEGKILIDYLFGKKDVKNSCDKKYGAFAGCFSFNCDSLNQFRLYGTKKEGEGTGLSLVFRKQFFSKNVKLAIAADREENGGERFTLFRCVYFNPVNKVVESIGHKDSDVDMDVYKEHRNKMDAIVKEVNDKIKELNDDVEVNKGNLDREVVERLLINLRYFIKDAGFKQEQECRIVKIYNLSKEELRIRCDEKNYKLYIEYCPKVSTHVDRVIFGPKADGMEQFQDYLIYRGLRIPCERSSHMLA